jgi:hypothetical protein
MDSPVDGDFSFIEGGFGQSFKEGGFSRSSKGSRDDNGCSDTRAGAGSRRGALAADDT